MIRVNNGIGSIGVVAGVMLAVTAAGGWRGVAQQTRGATPQQTPAPQQTPQGATPPQVSGRIDTSHMQLEDPAHQKPDLPMWAYTPVTAPDKQKPRVPDDGTLLHVPGSDKAYTRTQIGNGYDVPDWFPNMHPPAPSEVLHGRRGLYQGCGLCHLPTGYGRPENISINGLPVGYIKQQVEDFKNDLRHSSVPNAGLITMIPIAKNITPEELDIAANYFASVKPTKYIRVVETDTVPKTRPNARMLVKDEAGGTEPIGNRVIEIPEDVELVEMRDSAVGFVAYVPKGSIERGKNIVQTGDNGRVMACVMCHGPALKGIADIPPIAGRSPSQMARQLYDFKTGARHGKNSALMQGPVSKLTDTDIVNIVAYLSSLDQ
jgi:cytochrome c553